MGDEDSVIAAPAGWVDVLLESRADSKAGRTVDLLPLLEELRADADRLERILGLEPDEPQASARG